MAHLWFSYSQQLGGSTFDWWWFVGPKRCETLPGPRKAPSRLPQGRTFQSEAKPANTEEVANGRTCKRANNNYHIRLARIVPLLAIDRSGEPPLSLN